MMKRFISSIFQFIFPFCAPLLFSQIEHELSFSSQKKRSETKKRREYLGKLNE